MNLLFVSVCIYYASNGRDATFISSMFQGLFQWLGSTSNRQVLGLEDLATILL